MRYDEHGHICITPRQLHQMAFEEPDGLINHWLMPGMPWAFATSDNYARFLDFLADRTGIHPHHFLFRGSTKIGFRTRPRINSWISDASQKRWGERRFCEASLTEVILGRRLSISPNREDANWQGRLIRFRWAPMNRFPLPPPDEPRRNEP